MSAGRDRKARDLPGGQQRASNRYGNVLQGSGSPLAATPRKRSIPMANREYLLAAVCAAVVAGESTGVGQTDTSLLQVDDGALVSRADLVYRSPAANGTEGQPIGNGVMGTAVWTSPGALHFQINRCDVFSAGKAHSAGP